MYLCICVHPCYLWDIYSPTDYTDLHWTEDICVLFPCPSVPVCGTYILPLITLIYTEPRICIPRICANPCSSVGGYISPCALRRNLINLWPRLSCAFSQFSEINCHTLSLATLARYLNYQFMNLVMRRCRYPFLLADRPFPARGSVLTQMPKADAGAVRSSAGQNLRRVRRTLHFDQREINSLNGSKNI